MSSDHTRPAVLVFDVNETLLDITALEPLFERLFGDARVMREWFAQLILYSEAITLAGRYLAFGSLGAGVLKMVGETRDVEITADDVQELARVTGSLPAHADVAAALERLAQAGFRLVTLTNSAPPAGSPSPLERAGLAHHFERMFSVDAVSRFKPAPETYSSVTNTLAVAPEQTCLIAAHVWDTLGAQCTGARAALLLREGNAVLPVPELPQPDIVAADLNALADVLIERWA